MNHAEESWTKGGSRENNIFALSSLLLRRPKRRRSFSPPRSAVTLIHTYCAEGEAREGAGSGGGGDKHARFCAMTQLLIKLLQPIRARFAPRKEDQ